MFQSTKIKLVKIEFSAGNQNIILDHHIVRRIYSTDGFFFRAQNEKVHILHNFLISN